MVGVNLAGVGDWAIGSSRAGLSLATRLTAVENFVGFEEIFARRHLQRSGGHRVAINPRFRRYSGALDVSQWLAIRMGRKWFDRGQCLLVPAGAFANQQTRQDFVSLARDHIAPSTHLMRA